MELDVFSRVATFVLGAVGAAKIFYEMSIGKRSRMREEYKFARDFLGEVDSNEKMHPFLRERGYQAIAGDNRLTSEEVAYLLSLKGPDRALSDYVLGRPYLAHLPETGNLQVSFKRKFSSKWSRRWRMWLYLAFYLVSAFAAFSPLLFSKLFFKSSEETLVGFAVCLVVFAPYAWFSLRASSRIYRAEKLVQYQHKHTQRIVISS